VLGKLQINNQKTLLIGLLVTAAAIVLFETGTLRLDQNTFQAQAGMADMVLNNNGEGAIIEVGSHIMVTNKFESESFIAGTLGGIENGVIFIKEYKGDKVLPFAISDVGSVVYGEPKAVGKYFFKGLKYGAIGGLAGGTALWFLVVTDESGFDPIEAYPFCVGFVSMFTIPAGALGGLIKGAIKQGKAIEYIVGPNDWQIVQ